jgi:hypothetical protein
LVIFKFYVAKIIAEKVLGAFLSMVNIGEIIKIKAKRPSGAKSTSTEAPKEKKTLMDNFKSKDKN